MVRLGRTVGGNRFADSVMHDNRTGPGTVKFHVKTGFPAFAGLYGLCPYVMIGKWPGRSMPKPNMKAN